MGRKAYSPEKRLEMRNSVLAAARALFEAEGREAVTMRRVGKQLGLSAMALYGYFEGKEQLVGALLDEGFQELSRMIEGDGAATAFLTFADEHEALLRWMIESGEDNQWKLILDAARGRGESSIEVGTLLGLGLLRIRGAVTGAEFTHALGSVSEAA